MTTLFPPSFIWGTADSSYQVEGAWDADGKGKSIWDTFCEIPGRIKHGHTGKDAIDRYHKTKEDIEILRGLGVRAHRFSISWPRIFPAGTGVPSSKGLDFYKRFAEDLLAAGIEPWVTLYHWDLPEALQEKGGWQNPDSPSWFADYADAVSSCFGGTVCNYFTFNEPQLFIGCGYAGTIHAPGVGLGFSQSCKAAWNVLLAHGRASRIVRANSAHGARVGWALAGYFAEPFTDSREDVLAAESVMMESEKRWFGGISFWNDPVQRGELAPGTCRWFEEAGVVVTDDALKEIASSPDFLGINYYSSAELVEAGKSGEILRHKRPEGHPESAFGWAVTPRGFYWALRFLHGRYRCPLVVAENGMAAHDWPEAGGAVQDPQRVDFIRCHLEAYAQAIRDGVDGLGYFYWSLMDNFEWTEGYTKRFGLVYIDYETQKRIPKSSAYYYRDVIREWAEKK